MFIGGSIGPLGDVELRPQTRDELFGEQAAILEGPRRRRDHARDVLRPGRADDCDHGREARFRAADRRADDLRRRRPDARRRDRARGRRAPVAARRRSRRREPRRGVPPPPWLQSPRWSATGSCSRRCRTSGSRACPARASSIPTRPPSTSASSPRRRASSAPPDRRLLRHDADADRGDSRGDRRGPSSVGPAARRRAAAHDRPRRRAVRDGARAPVPRAGVRRLDPDRPAARRRQPRAARGRAHAIRESGKAHLVDVNDNPRARARMSGLMASVAIERFAGIETIPPPHAARLDGDGTRVAATRRACRGRSQHPRRHGRPARGSGLSRRGPRRVRVDAIGLTDLIAHLNRGEDFHGRTIDAPTSFYIGVAVNPTADDLDIEIERFQRKLDAGASSR